MKLHHKTDSSINFSVGKDAKVTSTSLQVYVVVHHEYGYNLLVLHCTMSYAKHGYSLPQVSMRDQGLNNYYYIYASIDVQYVLLF